MLGGEGERDVADETEALGLEDIVLNWVRADFVGTSIARQNRSAFKYLNEANTNVVVFADTPWREMRIQITHFHPSTPQSDP